jgi:hypothetical protein
MSDAVPINFGRGEAFEPARPQQRRKRRDHPTPIPTLAFARILNFSKSERAFSLERVPRQSTRHTVGIDQFMDFCRDYILRHTATHSASRESLHPFGLFAHHEASCDRIEFSQILIASNRNDPAASATIVIRAIAFIDTRRDPKPQK